MVQDAARILPPPQGLEVAWWQHLVQEQEAEDPSEEEYGEPARFPPGAVRAVDGVHDRAPAAGAAAAAAAGGAAPGAADPSVGASGLRRPLR